MPLVTCADCQHQVSSEAAACPNCGRPSKALPVQSASSEILTTIYILIIVAGAVLAYFFKESAVGMLGFFLIVLGVMLIVFRIAR